MIWASVDGEGSAVNSMFRRSDKSGARDRTERLTR